ncbi:MAG: hypothetical protein E6649_02690 [Paeniclostridium sordellii]|nr:hypothetical protein [Paeniclostridium sordellii]
MKLNKIKIYIVTFFVILINLSIICLYKLGLYLTKGKGLVYRSWINEMYAINIIILVIATLIFIGELLRRKSKIIKSIKDKLEIFNLIYYYIFFLAIIFILWISLFWISFEFTPEHIVYKDNKKVIAQVNSCLTKTRVEFFEPINNIFMKKTNIEGICYRGSYDIYDRKSN